MKNKKISVMIVDDHLMVRKGLAQFVKGNRDMRLVGEAENSRDAVLLYKQEIPDVALMDMKLPDRDGAATICEIRKSDPNARIIALTSFAEDEVIDAALHAGARGFLLKNISVEELANAIRIVHDGKTIFDSKSSEIIFNLIANTAAQGNQFVLSEREKSVLDLLVNGLTNKQIALQMKVKPSTVKQYLSSIFVKLRVQSRTEAATEALKLGLTGGRK